MKKIIKKIRQIQNAHTTKKMLKYMRANRVTYEDVIFFQSFRVTLLSDGKQFALYYTEDYNR